MEKIKKTIFQSEKFKELGKRVLKLNASVKGVYHDVNANGAPAAPGADATGDAAGALKARR